MSVTVTMPEVAETIVEGTIARWLKQPGDPVERYESIAEIVTDKVTLELPSPAAGFMGELLVSEGETVTVDTPIAIIETTVVSEAPKSVSQALPPTPENAAQSTNEGQARHSPLVRRLAEEHGIDLSSAARHGCWWTDHQGRRPTGGGESNGAGSKVAAAATGGALDPVRRAIAQRMAQSAHDIPHAWTDDGSGRLGACSAGEGTEGRRFVVERA